ncbi:phage major capsid protein [Mesobacterium sp. TK19101]|uniref:Phage major capsid protein n=1 Tax=Mesobacterium hydrothermale TaxID=3111907 RepID=A0ABU6HMH6_9RHOB|nr:phage major capsid protein [Mesobacterium sp. TK19101]MEC3863307.1 phage major capsid protein [Mesobacterium sp. TK19101]
MLDSVKISRRQSEIRKELATLAGKEKPTEDEQRSMQDLDREYVTNEMRYSAALIAEDTERREAGEELETRSDKDWSEMMGRFEMRQVALLLDEGRKLDGATDEIVSELRSQGGYRGVPVPWEALEMRAGETTSDGTPNPMRTAPIIDRLFADSAATRMGGRMINVGVGEVEYPVTTSAVSAGWVGGEGQDAPGPFAYTTLDRPMKPDNTLGITMKITRKALKQSGAGLEQAVRRDMNGAISEALDKAVFQGSGAAGEPTGLLAGAAGWGITETSIGAAASYAAFRAAAVRFMTANAASGPGAVNLLLRPELFDGMDDDLIAGTAISEWDRLVAKLGKVNMSSNALPVPVGDPAESVAVMTTTVGGVPPFFVASWGAVDLIRDPYSDAASGGLRLTALTTVDLTVSRSVQTEILTGLQ